MKRVSYYLKDETAWTEDFAWRREHGIPSGKIEHQHGGIMIRIEVSDEDAIMMALKNPNVIIEDIPATFS